MCQPGLCLILPSRPAAPREWAPLVVPSWTQSHTQAVSPAQRAREPLVVPGPEHTWLKPSRLDLRHPDPLWPAWMVLTSRYLHPWAQPVRLRWGNRPPANSASYGRNPRLGAMAGAGVGVLQQRHWLHTELIHGRPNLGAWNGPPDQVMLDHGVSCIPRRLPYTH